MDEKKGIHNVILSNKNRLSISQVVDVDTFDEGKIILYIEDDSMVVEGLDLHIKKLDIAGGELLIEGEITAIWYEGKGDNRKKGKGIFKRMLK